MADTEIEGNVPLRIRSLKLLGAKRTKSSVIEAELQGVYAADTLGDVLTELQQATAVLDSLGIFSSVNASLEKAHSSAPGEADLVVTVQEKK